jgi:hypothetical protein
MSAYPVTADKIADLRDKFRDASSSQSPNKYRH